MNSFVRRLTVLSVVWALLEMLLPNGKQQSMIRMTMGVLVMTALLSQVGQWVGGAAEMPAWSVQTIPQESYQRTALQTLANQLENYCVQQAQRAGYQAQAGIWLRMDGSVESIRLSLTGGEKPLLTREELRQHLAQQLQIDSERIRLEET